MWTGTDRHQTTSDVVVDRVRGCVLMLVPDKVTVEALTVNDELFIESFLAPRVEIMASKGSRLYDIYTMLGRHSEASQLIDRVACAHIRGDDRFYTIEQQRALCTQLTSAKNANAVDSDEYAALELALDVVLGPDFVWSH